MLQFLIDNIFVGIPMGTNSSPLLADLFLFSYESTFLQTLVKNKKTKETISFNFTFRYIDDVLSINNPNFFKLIPLIYSHELDTWSSQYQKRWQTRRFCYWNFQFPLTFVAIYQLHLYMGCIFPNLFVIQELAVPTHTL